MTAQAPYESQAREMLQRLESVQPPNVILQQLQILGDMAALLRCICAAASPDAAPVSAGGDAVAFRWQVGINANAPMSGWCTDMGTLEQVKRSSTPRIEYAYAATPAPPVGADWVVVRNLAEKWRMMAAVDDRDGNVFQDGRAMGYELCASDLDGLLAAAPTPAEARGVGDGVTDSMVIAAKTAWFQHDDVNLTPRAIRAMLEAAIAANKPAPAPVAGWCVVDDVACVSRMFALGQRHDAETFAASLPAARIETLRAFAEKPRTDGAALAANKPAGEDLALFVSSQESLGRKIESVVANNIEDFIDTRQAQTQGSEASPCDPLPVSFGAYVATYRPDAERLRELAAWVNAFVPVFKDQRHAAGIHTRHENDVSRTAREVVEALRFYAAAHAQAGEGSNGA